MKKRIPVKRGPAHWYEEGFDPEMENVAFNRGTGCSDRMCGAEDCLTCYSGNGWADQDEEGEEDYE